MKNKLSLKLVTLVASLAMVLTMVGGCGNSSSVAPVSSAAPVSSSESTAPVAAPEPEKMEGDEFNNGAIGEHGGVSSYNEYSSQIGIDILKAGGNAVDAAVATAFAIGVVEPNHSGLGGCGMMNVYLKDQNKYIVIEYMETVPTAVEPGWYNAKTDVNTAKNAAVPGQVYGLLTALEKYGTMTREQVMAPAIKLARDGFKMDSLLATAIGDSFDLFSAQGNEYLLKTFSNDGIPYSEGDLFKNPDLADTLQKISNGGIDEFYKGDLAQTIVDGLRKGGSLITMEDMANYTSVERDPIRTTYNGYEIVTVPAPSNGGDWLLEMLNIMENYDLKSMGANSPEYLYTFNEACRLGLADSYAYIGDPAFFNLPIDQMISKEYTKERVALMPTNGKVNETAPAGDLPVSKVVPTGTESKNTSHIAIIDDFGNIVSTTNTIGNGWGCKYMVEGTGFFYNSHIGNLEHDPANSDSPDYVMPGKRVRSTISPTIVLKDGEPVLAIGSPGSLAIPPAIAMVINNILVFDMNVQQAINMPRALAINRSYTTGPTTDLTIEAGRFDPATVKALEDYGYKIKEAKDYDLSLGGIAAIYIDKSTGKFYAGGDPRRDYKALAY